MTDMVESTTCAFLFGRKGVLYLVRPNGKKEKLGMALRKGKLWFWDRKASTWREMPDVVPTTAGHAVTICAMRVDS